MSPALRLLVVLAGCLVLLLAAIFLVYPYFQGEPDTNQPVATTPTDPSALTPLPADNVTPTPIDSLPADEPAMVATESAQRAEAERTTRTFVETYGSYSNFSNFSNITSLEPFMTESMKAYARAQIKTNAQPSVNEYTGVTSQLISLSVKKFELSKQATVNFTVQQETQAGFTSPIKTTYRDGRVELLYQQGRWLVNGLFYN